MLLRSLKLYNFRQYRGEQKIYFSTDKEKNVTVILGKNTDGKTTIVQAFNWVLYDKITFQDKSLLNIDVQNEMVDNSREKVLVEIELMHDDIEYTITRSIHYNCNLLKGVKESGNSILNIIYKQQDGQTKSIKATEHKNIINKILPESLSDYFFFDGERIENISNRQDVSEAVKGLMGLSILDAAINHLAPNRKNSVYGKFKSGLDLEGNSNAIEIQSKLENAERNRDDAENSIKNVVKEIEYYNSKKDKLANELRENESTSKIQIENEKLEHVLKIKLEELAKLQKNLVSDFNNEHYAFFSQELSKKAMELLSTVEEKTQGVPEMNVKSIEYLLKRGKCLCGNELKENTEALKNILKEMDLLPPNCIGTIVRQFTNSVETYNSVNDRYYQNIITRYKQIRECKDEITNIEHELKNISLEIINSKDMRQVEQEFLQTKTKINELVKKKDALLISKGRYEREIEINKKRYDSLAIISEKNKKVFEYLEYTNKAYEWFKITYVHKESEIRSKLNNKVNDIFSKMYHGNRKVLINDRYRIELFTSLGNREIKSDESRGLETVKNFAFIAGLVDLAKEKIIGETSNQILSSEPYPLVMDAPFSNADEIHVSNISKILPQIAEQIIMVVMEKDWKFADVEMSEKVGKEYNLDKQSETLTYIREVEV